MFVFTEKALVITILAALFIAIIIGTLIHQLMVRDKEALLIRDIKFMARHLYPHLDNLDVDIPHNNIVVDLLPSNGTYAGLTRRDGLGALIQLKTFHVSGTKVEALEALRDWMNEELKNKAK